jgi:IclR family acetate operon transcriptional repressor
MATKASRTDVPNKRGGKPRYAAPAVDQALDIVEYLSRNSRSYGINELARTLSVSTNTVYRILRRLTERGYTEQDPSGGYRLGARFFSLGMSLYHRFDLRLRARPHLERLAEQAHETAQIHVPDKDRAMVLDCVSPLAEFFLSTTPGSRFFYHPNAFGKAILAFMPADRIRDVLPEELPAMTPNTIVRRSELITHLATIRKSGIAYDLEEYTSGFFCIGAPVFDVTGAGVAGIGITGVLRKDTPARFKGLERAVLRCARGIAADIGYSGHAYLKFEAGCPSSEVQPKTRNSIHGKDTAQHCPSTHLQT